MRQLIWKRTTQVTSNKNSKGEGLRSGFEVRLTNELARRGVAYEYEAIRIPYTPKSVRHYVPDLILENGIIIEIKGRFTSADRQKHKYIKQCYPDLDIRFVFQRSTQKLSKTSQTTYAKWCETNGFKYNDGYIPLSWAKEPKNETNLIHIQHWRRQK
ncbi:endonuclease I [Campylobacter hyointestinalis subsp. hyointestinalis]|uniref:GxxExxY protein n=1 Tax=Campylobacter hyointestinalis TaxID=198 RepID=UPI0009BD6DF9|nr:GxxExxY protein [Campylobacter hyointestinalis]PPB51692.1 endonuclease I [Campylobacter hyointestinalis subsp. hyointestinalis]PPB55993.1 endonuclease I [Campylobacter hyointestinalis subsp. hyointestinalis]PPB61432.1 endonuclease I [Campylobacter hyointestinalis subsp. hyointestinalis]